MTETETEPEPGTHCRSGCRTRDHASFGECLRASNIQIGKLS